MTDKDSNYMTASELLRKAGNGYDGSSGTVMTNLIDLMGLSRKIRHSECCYDLADKIDAELAQARELSLRRGAELWAKANGWPDFRDGEDFGAWLERCALKLPCDKDGEPWSIGDRVMPGNRSESTVTGYDFDGNEWFLKYRWCGIDSYANEFATSCKRPAPEVLLGDGKPVSKGETVYVIESGIERTVKDFGTKLCEGMDGWDGSPWVMFDNGSWMHARDLTHTPPDTQESIDRDARKGYMTYWECVECSCERCPARIDGDKPWRWYHADSCEGAMVLDLLRRQRELDKRKGGAE